ncbi:MAG: PilN domain-containing protein [Oligoflexales bacterium]
MIFINLTPPEEIENNYWYVPDVAAVLLAFFLSHSVFTWMKAEIRNDIDLIENKRATIAQNMEEIKPQVKRYKEINKEMNELRERIQALKNLTISELTRFRPVIILEQIQTLMPKGVWLIDMRLDVDQKALSIQGGALDNLLVAEFMNILKSTSQEEIYPGDMRTQIYFSHVLLQQVSKGNANPVDEAVQGDNQDAAANAAIARIAEAEGRNFENQAELRGGGDLAAENIKFTMKIRFDERRSQQIIRDLGEL